MTHPGTHNHAHSHSTIPDDIPLRILSFDGGERMPVSLLFLREVERFSLQGSGDSDDPDISPLHHWEHSFLRKANLFAGSGMGSIPAVCLAVLKQDHSHWSTLRQLQHCIELCIDVMEAFLVKPATFFRYLLVGGPLKHGCDIQAILEQAFGKRRTFLDLRPDIRLGVVALDLRSNTHLKVFHNFGQSDTGSVTLVDAVMRSLAMPSVLPIWQGHISGEVFAIHPGPSVLSTYLSKRLNNLEDETHRLKELNKLLKDSYMFSLGRSTSSLMNHEILDQELQQDQTDWGYFQWLLRPQQSLALLDAFHYANIMGNQKNSEMLFYGQRCNQQFRLGYNLPYQDFDGVGPLRKILRRYAISKRQLRRNIRSAESFVLDWLDDVPCQQFNCGITHSAIDTREWVRLRWIPCGPSVQRAKT